MPSWRVQRRLRSVSRRLARLREELAVTEPAEVALRDDAEDAALRALVSEGPWDRREQAEAERHAQAVARRRAELVEAVAALEREQDELLDELAATSAARRGAGRSGA